MAWRVRPFGAWQAVVAMAVRIHAITGGSVAVVAVINMGKSTVAIRDIGIDSARDMSNVAMVAFTRSLSERIFNLMRGCRKEDRPAQPDS